MLESLVHRFFGIVPGLSRNHAGWDNLVVASTDAQKGLPARGRMDTRHATRNVLLQLSGWCYCGGLKDLFFFGIWTNWTTIECSA